MELMNVCPESLKTRARTAMERYDFSRPVKQALRDQIITKEKSVFDYGCGRGSDVEFLKGLGVEAAGWDPNHNPDADKVKADVVNLGFVVNVIESEEERVSVIKDALSYAQECLVVSAQPKGAIVAGAQEHGDGYLTRTNTFQKYFTQDELKELIAAATGKNPYPASQCVFYVFMSEQARIEYLSNRYDSTRFLIDIGVPFQRIRKTPAEKKERRRATRAPSVRQTRLAELAENELAAELVEWVSRRGRMPKEFEFDGLVGLFGNGLSFNALQGWVMENVDEEKFQKAQELRQQGILMFLATSRIDVNGRPKASALPADRLSDIKYFFRSYSNACEEADRLLFSVGNPENIAAAINESTVGKKLPDAMYVHTSALPYIPDTLQLFVELGRLMVGEIEGDVIVKIPRKATSISFNLYKDFDEADHPELLLSVQAHLVKRNVRVRNYQDSDNPPILHRKETFVMPDYPGYTKFKQLTEKEESLGLLSRSDIGFKKGWEKVLEEES